MAKKVKTTKTTKAEIEEAAKAAAEEAVEEIEGAMEFGSPEERDLSFANDDHDNSDQEDFEAKDAWMDGPKLARKRGLPFSTRVYKNDKWIGTKKGPYLAGWEGIQKENPEGGFFKAVVVDSNNKYLTSQQIEIAPLPGYEESAFKRHDETKSESSPFEILEVMKENQREAESKAQMQQGGIATMMSGIMQAMSQNQTTMMQIQQQTQQTMMQMMQESNKQFQALILSMQQKGPDPMLNLVTTLLTQKPKDDNGFTTANVLKMIQDAESRAEARANKTAEIIDKKANELAEMKAEAMVGGEGEAEEGGFKGLIKGFIPVLTQMVANQAAQTGQPTPEQIAQMQEARMLQSGNGGLDQGFIDQQGSRPAVPAPAQVRRNPAPQPAQRPAQAPVVAKTPEVVSAPPTTGPTQAQAQAQAARKRDDIFTFAAPDIGQAMMAGESASKTALTVLEKLEKEGVSRQTVASTFKLEHFFGYADQYQLPPEAKPWLKDFHEAIQESVGPKPVRVAPAPQVVTEPVNGQSASNGAKPVAASGGPKARVRPSTESRTPAKSI